MYQINYTAQSPKRKDVFQFRISHEKGVHVSNDLMSDSSRYNDFYDGYYDVLTSAEWVINFDNMDYLKTTDGTTCPDGKTKLTSGGNHSCK